MNHANGKLIRIRIFMSQFIKSLNKFGSVISASLYVLVGVTLIVSTKYIFSELLFPFPIFISAIGQCFTSLLVHILVKFKFVHIRPEILKIADAYFLVTRIGSIGIFATLALVLGNYAYLYINVSLIQILKSFTPVVTMLLSFLVLKLTVTVKLIAAISILTLGTLITTADLWTDHNQINPENAINLFGVFMMLTSSLSEALKVVLTQKLLRGEYTQNENKNDEEYKKKKDEEEGLINHNDKEQETRIQMVDSAADTKAKDIKLTVHESMYYYAPVSFLFMIVLGLFAEAQEFMNGYSQYMRTIVDNLPLFALVSVLGYGVMISSFFVTKYFSGLYLKALAVCRNFILVLTVVYYGEIMTMNQMLGYAVSMMGFVYYNYIRLQK